MKYHKEDLCIQELIGVPMAYMEIPTEFGVIRFTYKTIRVQCKEWGRLIQFAHETLEAIKHQLASMTGGYGIIWWRHKPEIQFDNGYYHYYCRIETSPQIHESFWTEHYWTKEGEISREIV